MTSDKSKHSSTEGLANIQLLFKEIADNATVDIQLLFKEIADSATVDIQLLFKEIADSFAKRFPRFTEDSFKLLAKGGWYGHDDMPVTLIENTTMDIESNDYKSADRKMVEFFESTYAEDKPRILAKCKKRSQVLASAFDAHERRDYILSIPVFLAQVDGVCHDVLGLQAYKAGDRKKNLGKLNELSILDPMLLSLFEDSPLTTSEHNRKLTSYPPHSLNRHLVVHGESLDYGTEINSFKTISLLNFIYYVSEAVSKKKTNGG